MGDYWCNPVLDYAGDVSAIADRHPHATAGVARDGESVVLYLVGRSGDVRAAVEDLDNPYSVPLRVVEVRHSSSELDAVMERLIADWDSLDGQGIVMTGFGPNVKLNKITISLLDYTADVADRLYAAYGTDLIVVSTTSRPPTPRFPVAPRPRGQGIPLTTRQRRGLEAVEVPTIRVEPPRDAYGAEPSRGSRR